MVSSRHRSSTTSESTTTTRESTTTTRAPKRPIEDWTTREKLCLTSLAIKYNNAWNSVARNMMSFLEKDRPEGWSNQKTCAAQFDRLMNELGVDKRPKRNEPSDGNSSSVIYKKMAEKRIRELEESLKETRKLWLNAVKELEAVDDGSTTSSKSEEPKQKAAKVEKATPGPKLPSKANTSITSETEKPPTRALTRRESSRQNLEKTLSILYEEACKIKSLNQFTKPSQELERENFDKVIRKHIDLSNIKKRLGGEVEDPHAVVNDLLIMFQNATMFYAPEHPTHKIAVELRDKLVLQWEKALIERSRSRH